ncbi:MAG: response regulator [Sedimentisphaerales bacterium]|nr:response regulator [Sedimentisphaerales bacterium]
MSDKILFVDDDDNLLSAYKRQLHGQFDLVTATNGMGGLDMLKTGGSFAIIVSDMRMPEMDGVEFLSRAKEISPDSIRMVLTGHAEIQAAIDSVNEGNIFRFLLKPCPPEIFTKALQDGLAQYHLIKSEHELLSKTLRGAIKVMSEILGLINPTAFSQASRIKRYVRHIAREMRLKDVWQYEIAAMLSQIGCVTLPPVLLHKVYKRRPLSLAENRMYTAHPEIAARLLVNIPRMERISVMIAQQHKDFEEYESLDEMTSSDRIAALGAQMIKIALEYDRLVSRAVSGEVALNTLRKKEKAFNPAMLVALENFKNEEVKAEVRQVTVDQLEIGMVTDEPIKSAKGMLLVPLGHEITHSVLERLKNFSHGGVGLREPFRVRVVMIDEEF